MGVKDKKNQENLLASFKTPEEKKNFILMVKSKQKAALNLVNKIRTEGANHVILQSLAIEIKTQNIDWVKKFIENNGVSLLLVELSKSIKVASTQYDYNIQHDLISCLISLLNTDDGADAILKYPDSLKTIVQTLEITHEKTQTQILMFLSLLSSYSKQAFFLIIDSFKVFFIFLFILFHFKLILFFIKFLKIISGREQQFSFLLEMFKQHNDSDFRVSFFEIFFSLIIIFFFSNNIDQLSCILE